MIFIRNIFIFFIATVLINSCSIDAKNKAEETFPGKEKINSFKINEIRQYTSEKDKMNLERKSDLIIGEFLNPDKNFPTIMVYTDKIYHNLLQTTLIYKTQKENSQSRVSFYYLGHFSKFIRPGAKRIICLSNTDSLLASAFINRDNSLAILIMNQADNNINFKLWLEEKGTLSEMPANSVSTLIIK